MLGSASVLDSILWDEQMDGGCLAKNVAVTVTVAKASGEMESGDPALRTKRRQVTVPMMPKTNLKLPSREAPGQVAPSMDFITAEDSILILTGYCTTVHRYHRQDRLQFSLILIKGLTAKGQEHVRATIQPTTLRTQPQKHFGYCNEDR
ncbi:hypothetical protein NCU10057 [Neurospora crassa OR74A]|uniref:Uncharacterized protein n=1 Tax=Neurospora crassa (strain ATCC 24698 / 74-OR23-1A / CBS 708.71 / DSM 1257 / FGSC 987) TaxID=367110 RepID=V5IKD0_NEUCR|nr:hypothetical protein NCU10057 [Neurospora crassa OR74A]ESA41883.1 hypothetical protein NCU10057 [Neurospora crassa OR74A]|eukprot:XP_011395311.1 hypothetical protein NCU10057 [Neurospora crassa OR74A]